MKEHPILFSAPMVCAILDGAKTQTRRICKPAEKHALSYVVDCQHGQFGDEEGAILFNSPYGKTGDRLWVRETWRAFSDVALYEEAGTEIDYRATPAKWSDGSKAPWKPSIHMPRWASRITLEMTGVRVERLQDISEADAMEEGCCSSGWTPSYSDPDNASFTAEISAVENYAELWEKINGAGSWDANPWVWVIEFKYVKAQLAEPA